MSTSSDMFTPWSPSSLFADPMESYSIGSSSSDMSTSWSPSSLLTELAEFDSIALSLSPQSNQSAPPAGAASPKSSGRAVKKLCVRNEKPSAVTKSHTARHAMGTSLASTSGQSYQTPAGTSDDDRKPIRKKGPSAAATKSRTTRHARGTGLASTSGQSYQTTAATSHVAPAATSVLDVSSLFSATDRSKDGEQVSNILKKLPLGATKKEKEVNKKISEAVIEEFTRRALDPYFPTLKFPNEEAQAYFDFM